MRITRDSMLSSFTVFVWITFFASSAVRASTAVALSLAPSTATKENVATCESIGTSNWISLRRCQAIDDEEELKIYKSALGSADLALRAHLVKDYRLHFLVCQKQLLNNMIPLSCYEEISILRKLHKLGVQLRVSASTLNEAQEQFDQKCHVQAARIRFQSPWVRFAENVSPACRQSIERNMALQRYKAGQL